MKGRVTTKRPPSIPAIVENCRRTLSETIRGLGANTAAHTVVANRFPFSSLNLRNVTRFVRSSAVAAPLPFALKDNFCTRAAPTSCSSALLARHRAAFDCSALRTLLAHDRRFVLVGKCAMDEWGCGSFGVNSAAAHEQNGNFWHGSEFCGGGSSWGCAFAVAQDSVAFAIGSDSGGSCRTPAALHYLYGFKPSYGLVSRHGLIPMANQLDTVGLLSKSISIIKLVLAILVSEDENDATMNTKEVQRFRENLHSQTKCNSQVKFLVPMTFHDLLSKYQADLFKSSIDQIMRKSKAKIEFLAEKSFDFLPKLNSLYKVLLYSDFASNMSRMTGATFEANSESKHNETFWQQISQTRSEKMSESAKSRILIGKSIAFFEQHLNLIERGDVIRAELHSRVNSLLAEHCNRNQVSFLLMPTVPQMKVKKTDRFVTRHDSHFDIFTTLANICNLPAISMPMGRKAAAVQLIGSSYSDSSLLSAVESLEKDLYSTEKDGG